MDKYNRKSPGGHCMNGPTALVLSMEFYIIYNVELGKFYCRQDDVDYPTGWTDDLNDATKFETVDLAQIWVQR